MKKRDAELRAGLLFVKTHFPAFRAECESYQASFDTATQILDAIHTVVRFKRTQDEFDHIIARLEAQLNTVYRLRVQIMHALVAPPQS